MTRTLEIGVWGCGGMGQSLTRALTATGEAVLTVAHDVVPEAAQTLVATYGGKAARSKEELLSWPGLDGIIIALPPYLHAGAVVETAEAGLGVFVEKPMALDVASCAEMIEAAAAQRVTLMVGHVLRYYEPYRSIRRWSAEGRFGRIYAGTIWRLSEGGGFASPGHWRARRDTCGGYLYEVGAHELDMLRCLMGEPRSVFAVSQKVRERGHEIEDHIAATIRFPCGDAVYEGATGSHVSRYGFHLFYENATLTSSAAFDREALQINGPTAGHLSPLLGAFSDAHPVEEELRDWLSALRGESEVTIPGTEGLATVALIEAAYRSAARGEIVSVDAITPEA
jgi:myo-inositol 2-dehydrogenase/D-chiro-inositol 1-dehydrogenase